MKGRWWRWGSARGLPATERPKRPRVGSTLHGDRCICHDRGHRLRSVHGPPRPATATPLQRLASLPRGFYAPHFPDTLARGDLVRVCLPEAHAPLALERRYIPPGAAAQAARSRWPRCWQACRANTVHVDSAGIRIGAHLVIHAPAVEKDSRGRPIDHLLGAHVMGPGECFVLSTYAPTSYDSRYFGAVDCSPPHVVLTARDEAAHAAAVDAMRRDMFGASGHAAARVTQSAGRLCGDRPTHT